MLKIAISLQSEVIIKSFDTSKTRGKDEIVDFQNEIYSDGLLYMYYFITLLVKNEIVKILWRILIAYEEV